MIADVQTIISAGCVGGLYDILYGEMRSRNLSTHALAKQIRPRNNRMFVRLRDRSLRPDELNECLDVLGVDVRKSAFKFMFVEDSDFYIGDVPGSLYEITRQISLSLAQLAEQRGISVEPLAPGLCKSFATKWATNILDHQVIVQRNREATDLAA